MGEQCDSGVVKPKLWYKKKIFIVFAGLAALYFFNLILLSYNVDFLNRVFVVFWEYTKITWWAILLGLGLGGLIDYFVPQAYVSKELGKNHFKSVVKAVVLGFLMSACSHGILAVAIELYKKGASTASVIAFLLASPWANMVITVLLFGFFGLKAFLFVGLAVGIALITGLVYEWLDDKNLVEHNPHTAHVSKEFSIRADIKRRIGLWKFDMEHLSGIVFGFIKGSWNLSEMVLWWIVLGMLFAGIARAYIPEEVFQHYMGPTFLGMLVVLVLAILMEVCSEGTAPVAFELFRQTGAFGNSFIFLMAGVITDYTEIGLIWANIGRKAALWLPIITIPQVFVIAYLFNLLL